MADIYNDFPNIIQRKNNFRKSLKQFMAMFNLSQLINSSTRVIKTTSSLLDLIIVWDPFKFTKSDVSCIGIRDHLVKYCTREMKKL